MCEVLWGEGWVGNDVLDFAFECPFLRFASIGLLCFI